jgi:hypothetical protein
VAAGPGRVALAAGALFILDTSNPASPTATRVPLPEAACHVELIGSLVYVAAQRGGLTAVDVSDLSRPRLLWDFPSSPGPWSRATDRITIAGGVAWVLEGGREVRAIDITSSSPQQLSSFSTPRDAAVVLASQGILVAAPAGPGDPVWVFDIKVPRRPLFLSAVNPPGGVSDLAASGGLLLTAGSGLGLWERLP